MDLILYGSGPTVVIVSIIAFIIFRGGRRGLKSAVDVVRSPAFYCLVALLLDAVLMRPPIFGLMVFAAGIVALMLVQGLFNPEYFWLSLACVFCIWISCRGKSDSFRKVVADWITPLLIGMGAMGVLALAATLWIPRVQWVWLFRLEGAARTIHEVLDAVLPKALWARMTILILVLSVDVLLPQLHRWTARFNKGMKGAKKAASSVAVFVSMTLFGAGQTGAIGQKVATEKHARLEKEATAIAQLAISARLQEMPLDEVKATTEWLNAIEAGVRADLAVPFHLQDRSVMFESDKSHLQSLISARVEELHQAVAKQPMLIRATGVVDARLAGILGRPMTEEQRRDAKTAFDKTLENFVLEGAKFASEPLTDLLTKAGTPDMTSELVKELYKEQIKRLSKIFADPLADVMFRPNTPSAVAAPTRIMDAARRPVFDVGSLSREVVRPTATERIEKATREVGVRETVKRAARK